MADPTYDYQNSPSMKAARAALAAEEEEIPEDMPDATVTAPFEQPPTGGMETIGLPVGGQTDVRVPPTGYVPAGEPADILQSPRAAAGGPGETVPEIAATAEALPAQAAEAEEQAEAALGEDIDLSYAQRLIAMSEGGIIEPLPPEVLSMLRKFVTLSNQMNEYEQASTLATQEMER
jgi:hypothetical protein